MEALALQGIIEDRPFVVVACGIAGMRERQTQSREVQRHLGDECRTEATVGLNRTLQGLAVQIN
jgi:hypothetical protein